SELGTGSIPTDSTIAVRASQDYRCWREFRSAIRTARDQTAKSEILLTGNERQQLERAVVQLDASLASVPRGALWWLGKVKSVFGIEPPEPEELEVLPKK